MTRYLLSFLLLTGIPGILPGKAAVPAPLQDRSFLWQQANAEMASARTPTEFLRAGGTYQELVDLGVRNTPLFVNLGSALLQAGYPVDAFAVFLRAERYGGSDPEIRRALRTALAQWQGVEDAPLPWYRALLFWHYRASCPARTAVAASGFIVFWIALILRILNRRLILRPALLLGLLLFVLFGSSVGASLYQEMHVRRPMALSTALPAEPASPPASLLPAGRPGTIGPAGQGGAP